MPQQEDITLFGPDYEEDGTEKRGLEELTRDTETARDDSRKHAQETDSFTDSTGADFDLGAKGHSQEAAQQAQATGPFDDAEGETYVNGAKGYAQTASASATEAEGSADDSSEAASEAASYRDTARDWASKLGGPVIPIAFPGGSGGLYSSRHYAQVAQAGAEHSIESIDVQNGDLVVTLVSGETVEGDITDLRPDLDVLLPLSYSQPSGSLRQSGGYLDTVQATVDAESEQVTLTWQAPAAYEARIYQVQRRTHGVWKALALTKEETYTTDLLLDRRTQYAVAAVGIPQAEVIPPGVDTTPLTVSGYSAEASGRTATVAFDADEPLAAITNLIMESGSTGVGNIILRLRRDDFVESEPSVGAYHYEAQVTGLSGDSYRSLLSVAEDYGGNGYAGGELSDTFTLETRPQPPTDLGAEQNDEGEVALTWTNAPNPDVTITELRVLRSTGDATLFTQVATLAPGAASYAETRPQPDLPYYYALVAVAKNGLVSERSEVVRVSGLNTPPYIEDDSPVVL